MTGVTLSCLVNIECDVCLSTEDCRVSSVV